MEEVRRFAGENPIEQDDREMQSDRVSEDENPPANADIPFRDGFQEITYPTLTLFEKRGDQGSEDGSE